MKKSKLRILVAAAPLFVFVLLLGAAPVFAAGPILAFQQTWGGPNSDRAAGVAVASDGSIYATGTTFSFGTGVADGDSDAVLLKFALDGTLVWQRTYGVGRVQPNLPADDFANAVAVGPDGSVFIAGSFSNGDAFLAKFDPNGNRIWDRTWGGSGGDFAEGVAVASDGSSYITGLTNSFGAGNDDMFLVKFAPDGTLIWQKTWGGAINEFAHNVAVAPDGSIYVAGDGNSFFGNDAILLKFAPDGALIWQRDWREGTIQDISAGEGVAVAADGSVYMAGRALVSGVGQHVFLVKFASTGSLVWQKTWGAQTDTALGVAVASTGTIYVTGNTGFGAGGGDAFVLSFLPTGRAQDARTWGGVNNESGEAIAVGPDGNIYVAGVASAPPYVFKRASHTTKTPRAFLGTPTGTITVPAGTVGVPNGTVLTPNGSLSFAGATDAALLKIRP